MIKGTTKFVGVIGHPVAHSLSPGMHNAAFAALGMNYCYVAFDVTPDALPDALLGMKALGIVGLNITIPHKPAAFTLMDRMGPSAAEVEAVNTVHLKHGLLVGHNTDVEGFARSLEAAGVVAKSLKAVLIGAGGAARSVAAALLQQDVNRLTILNRTPERAEALANRLRLGLAKRVAIPGQEAAIPEVCTLPMGEGEAAVREADIVVQCTSVGMHPGEAAARPVPAAWLRQEMVVCDLIYNPEETSLLREARALGALTINGVEMLVQQGAVAFEIWTGVCPPVDIMRQALLEGLRGSG